MTSTPSASNVNDKVAGLRVRCSAAAPCEQHERVREPSSPCGRGDVRWLPERFSMFGDMQHLQPGGDDGVDDLTQGPLPFHGTPSRVRVVHVAATEVVAISSDAGDVLVPGPQRDRWM